MFVWWTGMPLIGLVFFAVMFAIVVYSFVSSVRGQGLEMEDSMGGRARRRDRSRGFSGGRAGDWECERTTCRAMNPGHAKFCRMCGRRR